MPFFSYKNTSHCGSRLFFLGFPPPPAAQVGFLGGVDGKKVERKKNNGKIDDRRQKVEEGDTSKRKSFSGNRGEMRKKR